MCRKPPRTQLSCFPHLMRSDIIAESRRWSKAMKCFVSRVRATLQPSAATSSDRRRTNSVAEPQIVSYKKKQKHKKTLKPITGEGVCFCLHGIGLSRRRGWRTIFCTSCVNTYHQSKQRANPPPRMSSQEGRRGSSAGAESPALCPCCIDEVKQGLIPWCWPCKQTLRRERAADWTIAELSAAVTLSAPERNFCKYL